MLPKLTFKSYFENFSSFLLEPKQARENDRIKAVGISVLIGVFTLGLAHAFTKIYKACHKAPEDLEKTEEKVHQQIKHIGSSDQKTLVGEKQNIKSEKVDRQEEIQNPIKKFDQKENGVSEKQKQIIESESPVQKKEEQVSIRPQKATVNINEKPLDARKFGLTIAEYHPEYKKVNENKKYEVRDITRKLINNIPDGFSLPDVLSQVQLFSSSKSTKTFTKDTQVLGRFDVLAVPAKMDFDYAWQPSKPGNKEFFIHHSAAINVGERRNAEDYKDYSARDAQNTSHLDEAHYLRDMKDIFHNILSAQDQTPPKQNGLKQAVWFPFGMGAFLRNLHKNDPSYSGEARSKKMEQLKLKIAETFVQELKKFLNLEIHLCLPYEPMDADFLAKYSRSSLEYQNKLETNQNYNAFIQALANAPDIKKNVHLHINCDATHVAQNLANQNPDGSRQVSLTNGANRNLIGNHWFDDRALVAIDENIHRRSFMAAIIAYACNRGQEVSARPKNYLVDRVSEFKGKVIQVT